MVFRCILYTDISYYIFIELKRVRTLCTPFQVKHFRSPYYSVINLISKNTLIL